MISKTKTNMTFAPILRRRAFTMNKYPSMQVFFQHVLFDPDVILILLVTIKALSIPLKRLLRFLAKFSSFIVIEVY